MSDPADLGMIARAARSSPDMRPGKTGGSHSERAHSKFSASGAERWFACPGSVALAEGLPDKPSIWAQEGTNAHEVLEALLRIELDPNDTDALLTMMNLQTTRPPEMLRLGRTAARFLLDLWKSHPGAEFLVESRVYLDFIHPEAFGTLDSAIVDDFGTLHVIDYKYGAGVPVSPVENLQMIFYGLALAHRYRWNFKKLRLWVNQPRVKSFEGPLYWDLPMRDALGIWVPAFAAAIERAERYPTKYVEGGHCHWCRAKGICPLKRETKQAAAGTLFSSVPLF